MGIGDWGFFDNKIFLINFKKNNNKSINNKIENG